MIFEDEPSSLHFAAPGDENEEEVFASKNPCASVPSDPAFVERAGWMHGKGCHPCIRPPGTCRPRPPCSLASANQLPDAANRWRFKNAQDRARHEERETPRHHLESGCKKSGNFQSP
jgi:hypothetical protein